MPPAANLITKLAFPGVQNRNPPDGKLLTEPRRDAMDNASIEYVYLRNPSASILVFVSHGRLRALDSESVQQWDDIAQKEGVSVLLHNYPGYGDTSGPITAELVCQDALQLLGKLCEPTQELVLLGNSVGCGPTMWLAVEAAKLDLKNIKVVLVSPYTSLVALAPFWIGAYTLGMIGLTAPKPVADVLAGPGRLSFLQGRQFCDPFPIIKLAGQLRPGTQVLLLHGSDDTTIPISHSKALLKEFEDLGRANARLVIIPKTKHKHTRLRGDTVIWAFAKGLGQAALDKIIADVETPVDTMVNNDVGTD